MTTVFGSGAVKLFTWASAAASAADGPLAYLTIVFPVQTTSSDVIGFPSDHFAPGRRWNVHVSPSFEVSQLVAQSPWITGWRPGGTYWTSCGYTITNTL